MIAEAESFLDTNVLVYATSRLPQDSAKRTRAQELLHDEKFGVSGQILQEFFVTVTRKIPVPLTAIEALEWIDSLEEFPFVPVDVGLVKRGIEISERYRISYWDGALLAAAQRLGAGTLFTEDLNHGQSYGSVTVINPFRTA